MKKILLFLVLVALGGFAYWPYQATAKFCTSVNAGDAQKLDEVVDWPALRGSVQSQLQRRFERVFEEKPGGRATSAQLRSIEAVVAELMENKHSRFASAENYLEDARQRLETPGSARLEIRNRGWISAREFRMRTNADESEYRFRLEGLGGWKLVGLEIDPQEFDGIMKAAFPPADGPEKSTPSAQ